MQKIPLESYEQITFTNWLDENNYQFSAIRNESDYNSIQKWSKRKREWVRKWISDFFIFLKNKKAWVFIELKRQKRVLKNWKLWKSPSKVSSEQYRWIDSANKIDNLAWYIAYWAKEAIEIIKDLESK